MSDRYMLQPSHDREGCWVLTDTLIGIVCVFKEGDFNADQKFTLLDDASKPSAAVLAEAIRMMGGWLGAYHYDLAFGQEIPARFAVGRQIAYLREAQGMTQLELAEASGINNANISKIEAGRYNASVDVLERIAKALNAEITVTQE